MCGSGGGRLSEVIGGCLHNNSIVERSILVTILHCRTPEPRLSTVYNISSCWNLIEIDIDIPVLKPNVNSTLYDE